MARQCDRVQLEQSDMHLALNMAKITKVGVSHATIKKMTYLIKKLYAEVWELKKRGVESPGHNKVKAAIECHPAMLRQYRTAGCPPCQNGPLQKRLIHCRCKGPGAPRPNRLRQLPPPGMPPGPTGDNSGAQCSQIIHLPARYMYLHTDVPCAEYFTLDASAKYSQHNTDFDPDILTDKGTSTG